MEVPRGFTRCDECEGKGYLVEEHIRTVAEHHPNCDGITCESTCPIPVPVPEYERVPCPSCSGSGLVPTEKLREEARRALFAVGDKPDPGDFHEWLDRQAGAVLAKVAEHLGGRG